MIFEKKLNISRTKRDKFAKQKAFCGEGNWHCFCRFLHFRTFLSENHNSNLTDPDGVYLSKREMWDFLSFWVQFTSIWFKRTGVVTAFMWETPTAFLIQRPYFQACNMTTIQLLHVLIPESYVYWKVYHCYRWVKRDQLDVTCFIISLLNAQHVSDVNTSILRMLIHPSWGWIY